MRGKKARKPSRSIRYLLYADQKLRKISLRRLSVRLKKARRSPKAIRSKQAVRAQIAVPSRWAAAAAGVTMCVVAVAAVLASREPAPRPRTVARNIPLEADMTVNTASTRPARASVETPRGFIETSRASVETTRASVEPKRPAEHVATTTSASAPPDASTAADAVTLTGCLERGVGAFVLKNASGAAVPASRSWKSGFLKKRPPQFDVVDATNTLKLPAHVGTRVAATGVLVDRELQARSLRRVAASCR